MRRLLIGLLAVSLLIAAGCTGVELPQTGTTQTTIASTGSVIETPTQPTVVVTLPHSLRNRL